MSEKDQSRWRGIRPTDPAENIPVSQGNQTLLKGTVWPGVSGYGVFPVLNPNLIAVQEYNLADNNTVIIYTVPVGKTFYMTTCYLTVWNIALGLGAICVRDEDDLNLKYLVGRGVPLNEASSDHIDFSVPYIVPASYDICVVSTAANAFAFAGIVGYRST